MVLTLLALAFGVGSPQAEDVFVSGRFAGQGQFDTFRIPALCVTRKGTLLALAEGRESVSDQAANALVLRRKERGSKAWTPLQVLIQDQPHALNNPCLLATKAGRVWLLYQRYPVGLNERSTEPGFEPKRSCLSFITWSDDDGKHWAKPVDISKSVKSATSQSDASGPGNGIELERGRHKGRLVFPMNEGSKGGYDVYALYSDDKGKSWKRGQLAPKGSDANPNETQIAELANGDLYMNARNQGARRDRLVSYSRDGGATWAPMRFDPQLPDPVCQGSTIRMSFSPDVMAFSNPNDQKSRTNGTLRLSNTGGSSWPKSYVIEPGSFAYSSLCRVSDTQVGILYESVEMLEGNREGYRIRFKIVDLSK